MKYSVRYAKHSDIEALEQLFQQLADTHYELRPDIFNKIAVYDREGVSHLLQEENRHVLVAVDEQDCVAGFVSCKVDVTNKSGRYPARFLKISNICTGKAFRKQGIGQLLLNESRNIAHEVGAIRIELNVFANNQSALDFYTQQGMTAQSLNMELPL